MKNSVVGKRIPRLDALEKVTGAAVYTADVRLPGMLYGKVLRSPYPHAEIVDIDTSEAEKLPGVKAVVCFKNTPRVRFRRAASLVLPPAVPIKDEYIFDTRVRYVGDEVAAVAAESEEIAAKALRLIKVKYKQLPAVYDPLEALQPAAPSIHDQCPEGKNIIGGRLRIPMGDVEKGFAEADYVFEHTFKLPVVKHAQLETMDAVAEPGAGGVTVWTGSQAPHDTRMTLAEIFGLPVSKVHIKSLYAGGGFGVRTGFSGKAEPIAVALALKAGKPVKVVYSREEDFIASDTRHAGYITVKTGVKKDGSFTARQVTCVLNGGAYASWSDAVAGVGVIGLSLYRCPNQLYEGYAVYTNTTIAGAMRGFGNPQVTFAVESQVDIIARELGMDPLEFRLKNITRPGDQWILPYPCTTSGLEECLKRGAAAIGWERRGKFDNSSHRKRGIGVAIGSHCSSAWPFLADYSNAWVTVHQDGSVHLASGCIEMGQGAKTTLAQMVADVMGVPVERVGVTLGDTEATPYDVGVHASRAAYAGGMAVVKAAQEARNKVLDYAAKVLEAAPENLDIEDGIVYVRNEPSRQMTLDKIAEHAHLMGGITFTGVGNAGHSQAPPWEAHFAEVEVDVDTGQVSVVKMVAAHDVGRAINPQIVEGQLEGGLAQGIGYALAEEIKYDQSGRQINKSFHEYMLPTALDVPEMEVILVETNDPTHPLGIKGVGETALVPSAPAVANAVSDAIGCRFFELPITMEKVYAALAKEREKNC